MKVILFIVFSLGVVMSASRSAVIGLVVVITVFAMLRYGRRVLVSRRAIIIAGFTAMALVLGMLVSYEVPSIRAVIFHSDFRSKALTEGSTQLHWQIAEHALLGALDRPLGCGLGCNGPASVHGSKPAISENYFIQILSELGVVGLALWLWVQVLVVRELYRLRHTVAIAGALAAIYVGISVIAMLLHIWTDDTVSMLWWIGAGVVIGYGHRGSAQAITIKLAMTDWMNRWRHRKAT